MNQEPQSGQVSATRFVPVRRQELLDKMHVDADMRRAAGLLHHVLRFESDTRREHLLDSYASFDPDPLVPVAPGGSEQKFLGAMQVVLEEANFERVTETELDAAFHERSLFPLAVHVDLDEYDVLELYKRGETQRIEKVRGPSTLWRWKTRELHLYERLVVVLRLRPEALVANKGMRTEGMEPGKIYLKSFKNIPTADLEMVLPNTQLTLRPIDRLLIYGPLIAGVGWTLYQSLGLLMALLNGNLKEALFDGSIQALGGVLLVLFGYLWKTHGKIKTQRLQYMKTLSSGLYFRNLANNASVLDQMLTFALNEEEKEALIAFHLLQQGPQRTKALDATAETWLHSVSGRVTDFDVKDGLKQLQTLGLADKHRGKWTAVDSKTASKILDERWDRALDAAA